MFYLTTHSTHFIYGVSDLWSLTSLRESFTHLRRFSFTVIWCQTYSKGPFKYIERKPAAATWATLSD